MAKEIGQDPATDRIVEELRARFARFRSKSTPYARVPSSLRAAVMVAIRQGVAPGRLRSACAVSSSQLDRWRASCGADAPSGAEHNEPRVFSVVDAPAPVSGGFAGQHSDTLELRLGPWSVQVRLTIEEREAQRG